MSRHQALIVGAFASCWMFGSLGMETARGQVHAFRPTTPPADVLSIPSPDEPLPYDVAGNVLDAPTLDMRVHSALPPFSDDCWSWQILPQGLIYPAYLAAGRESRFGSQWVREQDKGWLWDIALGGHVGMLRYGNRDPLRPEGWQVDIEGAAFPRLTLADYRDLVSVDFRFGVPFTFRRGPLETKLGYYHLSSHLGDEYMVRYATLDRINYARDVLIAGLAFRPLESLRLYAEAGWAFFVKGGSEPWEFQFGIDYSPLQPTGILGAPFFAVNARIREEVDYGGNMTAQVGLQWRGPTGGVFRTGFHYFNGMADQYQFFTEHEEQIGMGVWYDF
ncbi:MAG: hypothetical protein A2V98_17615 [Planctomycetes bacterium RBG_16_64_12]|nr:MAG: hypothetical protein A2V98_17615 [Planctomycetes bacterium RBG_16_64_12]